MLAVKPGLDSLAGFDFPWQKESGFVVRFFYAGINRS